MKYNLGFISDEDFHNHVTETVKKYRFQIDLKAFKKNLIDPIKFTFDLKVYGKSAEQTIESEILRQLDKSNGLHIGYFNQNLFKYIGNGWSVPERGYDVVNKRKHIYVEMKNKHNTMNSSSSQKTYMRMQNTLINDPRALCLLVEVIAKNSQDTRWITSLDGTQVSNSQIRRVSIDKFYEMVTGDSMAFKNMCSALPKAIDNILAETTLASESNTVIRELRHLSPDLEKSIYLLSFGRYEGFDQI